MCNPVESTTAVHGHDHSHCETATDCDIPEPGPNASESDWMDYACKVAESYGVPPHVVMELIRSKGDANFSGSIPSVDGTGERLYGPMMVHGGLLQGGKYADDYCLTNEDGSPLTAEDLEGNPAAGIRAGVQHLSNLIELYDGNVQMAVNHYQTGNPNDSSHDLGIVDPEGEHAGHPTHSHSTQHDHQGHHGSGHAHSSHAHQSTSKPDPEHDHSSHDHTDHDHSSESEPYSGHSYHSESTRPHIDPPAYHMETGEHDHESGHDTTTPPHTGHSDNHGAGHHTAPFTGTVEGPLTGDIEPGVGDGHPNDHVGGVDHGHGFLLNADAHNSAMTKIFGRPPGEVIGYVQDRLESMGAYNAGQNENQKLIGAYIATNLIMKEAMLPPTLFANETDAGLAYGQAKILAMNGDAEGLRNLIESHGGDTYGLTDEELISIWGTNEHNNLHGILFGYMPLANAVHMTSLNDNDSHAHDGMNPGLSGGYNNKGEYPQWGWYEGLLQVPEWFPELHTAPETHEAHETA